MQAPDGPQEGRPALLALRADAVPPRIQEAFGWAPWRGSWNPKRGKWDKIPHNPRAPAYPVSTTNVKAWGTFAEAVAAARAGGLQGVGALMRRGFVGIDLDNCRDPVTGAVEPWAQDIVRRLTSYTEISPTGTGLRIIVEGSHHRDWTNHTQGVEVYCGLEARFLTITGHHLASTPVDVLPASQALADLESAYAPAEKPAGPADVINMAAPEVLDELLLDDLNDINMPVRSIEFLRDGTVRATDRSHELHLAATNLCRAGLDDAEVFSHLVHSAHAMEVALDHRRQRHDSALLYLWREQCVKGRAKARASMPLSADDFDDLTTTDPLPVNPPASEPRAAGSPTAPPAAPSAPLAAFDVLQAGEFASRRMRVDWLIKGVLPRAEIGAVFGASGAGKSFLVLDLVLALARGQDWRGHRVREPAGVLYIAAEGAGGVSMRLQAHAEHHGYDLAGLPLWVLGAAPNLLDPAQVKDLVASMRARCGVSVVLVVVDTLAQVTPGANENSGEDMGRLLGNCRAMGKAAGGAMVLLVAHAGKDAERGLRGWSGIKAALDVEIQVERDGEFRAATITKLKDGEGEGEEFPFRLLPVALGEDEDGDPITSCVLTEGEGERAEAGKTRGLGQVQRRVYEVAVALIGLGGGTTVDQIVANVMAGEAPATPGKRDQRPANFARSVKALISAGKLIENGGSVLLP